VGFEFYLATSQVSGISLFDIRFKGDRIMYEVKDPSVPTKVDN
jgi:primary-amine oxidase